jgi:CRISPR-associated protein Csm1
MAEHTLLDPTTRVALAAYLHDVGKFAERAGIFAGDPRLEANLQLYCPYHAEGKWFSHRHAAHSALAIDLLEPYLPDMLFADSSPFVGRQFASEAAKSDIDPTDSLINAAAAHHQPRTFLQWIIATADRVASGFEREEFDAYNQGAEKTETGKNHYQARLLTLFEQIRLRSQEAAAVTAGSLQWRYPLEPLTPQTVFPQRARNCEPSADEPARQQYARLWDWFFDGIKLIPASHRKKLPLWFDHFDSLWMTATHAIPSATAFGVRPEVSLYDHSRTAAALAAALWRWHEAHQQTDDQAAQRLRQRDDFDVPKLLLVQGDFFGIQDFIFTAGGQTRRQVAKLLRGRSLQVSLFTEVAALRVLEALGLPATSVVINAAGKFLIVAPNTPDVRETLIRVRAEINAWFEQRTYGLAGLGLAWEPATCNDLIRNKRSSGESTPFALLLQRLHSSLELEKYRRFDLAQQGARVFSDADYPYGPCAWNGLLPADRQEDLGEQVIASCALSRDQVAVGESIVNGYDRLLVLASDAGDAVHPSASVRPLEVELFGYRLAFTRTEEVAGRFGNLATSGALRRCWDYSLPEADATGAGKPLFSGYARRFFSGYVPRVQSDEVLPPEKYCLDDGEPLPQPGELCTLDMLACEDRKVSADGQWTGVVSLAALKGDIDNLGLLFHAGLTQPSFAKWASLSRQVNGYFAIYLPWMLSKEFPRVYTVFAGGDDFFLLGGWETVQRLVQRMRETFSEYVALNPEIHFSAGIVNIKPGAPIQALAEAAEEALGKSKSAEGKDSITCFGETVRGCDWPLVTGVLEKLEQFRAELNLSTAYTYGLLSFVEMAKRERVDKDITASMWRARLAYRTRRLLQREVKEESARQAWQKTLMQHIVNEGIDKLGSAYRIPLFTHLYRHRRQ